MRSLALALLLLPTAVPLARSQPDAGRADEIRLLQANPQLARREGPTLMVGGSVFRDSGECEGSGTCQRYWLDHIWPRHGYAGIVYSDGEYAGYELQSFKGGNAVSVGDRPLFTPDGRHFAVATAADSDSHGAAEGVVIWSAAFPPQRIRAIALAVAPYPELVGWRSSGCLAFTAGRPGERRREYFVIAAAPEWRLSTDASPRACARN